MNHSPFLILLALPALFSVACTSNGDVFSMGGVPGWIADGATLESEPEPYRPDPAIIVHEDESGPVHFELITDRRNYAAAPVKKSTKISSTDPIERGRDARIRRLFR